ncbi:pyridoxamine 5'-phosphate oxidase family protein [Streptomyces sp. SID10815]|uniref:Pyridoxamine 5'-phosphate oxidase family protein n=1 Tax=Streptomyces similanensis TaxID=1274988 RepID=A0ABP9KBA2_9ACTN|nr:pyridoxamine 5'-phosphate oxidase family protein [Streptomyces sp. SID10815]NEA47326.1 pyridoxamine 5'-phosphate oxidase family protein [Streptomyces sp. SID10815]QKW30400.1 pyridoxamine 5'-phosphate oxidase family protein [Streptomyces seoulensis]
MGAVKVAAFSDIESAFVSYIQDIVYCTMITVDKNGRPRARVLLPVWETVDGRPVGWIAAYKTPVKAAHLANNPHTTYAYWNPRQNAVFVDSVSSWVDDEETKKYAWDLYAKGSPHGVGYNPRNFWRLGPGDPEYHVIKIEPWRVQVLRGSDLSSRIWTDASRG